MLRYIYGLGIGIGIGIANTFDFSIGIANTQNFQYFGTSTPRHMGLQGTVTL